MEFWQWLAQPFGLIQGDWTAYQTGVFSTGVPLSTADYEHAIRTAINNLATASDPTARREFFRRLQEAGGLVPTDDINYYIDGLASQGEIDNLIRMSSQRLYSKAITQPSTINPTTGLTDPTLEPDPTFEDVTSPTSPTAPQPEPQPDPTPDPGSDPGGGGGGRIDYEAQARALYPYLPDSLIKIFADAWAESGNAAVALGVMRSSGAYESAFPGIKRSDGTIRMSEQEWYATREAYSRLFREFGLNSDLFSGRFTTLMENAVSPSELASRLGAAYEQIITNIPEVKQAFSEIYGIGMTDQAIFAFFLDPDIADAILTHKISVAQVSGEGLARGFDVADPFAERLASAGVNQLAARQFFAEAEDRLPTLDELARRFRDPDQTFGLEEFAEASVFGGAEQSRRIRRLLGAERSMFTENVGQVRMDDDFALEGLRPR